MSNHGNERATARVVNPTPVAPVHQTWAGRPLSDLIDFILERYHESLRHELPQLVALSRKIEARHGAKPTCPTGLADHMDALHHEILDHLIKEEMVLFPAILSGQGARALSPIRAMEHEHREHGENLAKTRELTNDLRCPADACETWRELYARLLDLEVELMEHMDLENNVLFARVLNGG